ncbi:receptor-interacting serine/threonine-protein kinase 1-like, partial [Sinocyclocheilus grahami]|uniref:receptor-interacting serine/threonine-protein kinase 1-like n=1 Tax=Sinocyclocheilus grahami TaxID=75366 RepID=UPI0007AC8687
MATAASLSLMKSGDLIKKEPLDYGGFGEVYLCYHKTLGQVVLKTVYTGPPRNGRQKQSLLDEGSLMSRLSHQRVVKLLGVILEDGDYSLVMELIPKGNLLTMLETVTGEIYMKLHTFLSVQNVQKRIDCVKTGLALVHPFKKVKQSSLADEIIADLGLATSQMWSKLTKEESRRQSRLGKKSYARSEDQICHCVCQGERPDEALIPRDTPRDIVELMKTCWNEDPRDRPTFKGEAGSKCKSRFGKDSPGPLRSSDIGPVEASIEDLSFRTPEESLLEVDAAPPSSPNLELKLAQEYNYHKYGSRIVDQPDASLYNPLPQQPASSRWAGEASSVKSWTKPAAYPNPNPEEELHPRPASSFEGLHRPDLASQLSVPYSDYDRLQHPLYNRIKSCPDGASPAAESFMLDSQPGLRFSPVVCPPSDSGWPVAISNASAIQIGSYNTMNLRVSDNSSLSSLSAGSINRTRYNELLMTYEEYTVTENHLEVVRHN